MATAQQVWAGAALAILVVSLGLPFCAAGFTIPAPTGGCVFYDSKGNPIGSSTSTATGTCDQQCNSRPTCASFAGDDGKIKPRTKCYRRRSLLQSSAACGDPHFRGFSGAYYDFNGYPDAVFSVLSAPDYQVNALFSNLGNVRVVNNYMTQIGMLTPNGAVVVEVGAGNGQLQVRLAGSRAGQDLFPLMQPGTAYRLNADVLAEVSASHPNGGQGSTIRLAARDMAIRVFTAAGQGWLDLGIDLVNPAFPDAHGIVGQTWRSSKGVAPQVVNGMHVLEGDSDAQYEVSDGILGATTPFGLFKHATYPSARRPDATAQSSSTGPLDMAAEENASGDGDLGRDSHVPRRVMKEEVLLLVERSAVPTWFAAATMATASTV